MRKYFVFSIVILVLILTGCTTSIYDEPYTNEIIDRISGPQSEVTSSDLLSLSMAEVYEREGRMTIAGKTVGQIIKESTRITMEKIEEGKQANEEREKQVALSKERTKRIKIELVKKENYPFSVQKGIYNDVIRIDYRMTNNSGKPISAFKASFTLLDAFGESIFTSGITYDEGLQKGEKVTQAYQVEVSPFTEGSKDLWRASKVKLVYTIKEIIYADGTKE
ncbi:hypothetical protein M3661_08840 [Paenibacillus sp. MER 180]|uniref:hypothetical protein n=1 Tax=Paenibacillus sp. MER 180 TaxID=2939570 RepID=UPI00203AB9AB|nr:hypothetical protein [Paenibacillus sp. MER 180]MCM3290233.1 hypothetical protein [Paenibacillus sp. MER 180]